MQYRRAFISGGLLVSLLLLLNPSVSSPAAYAQNLTPTRVAPQYPEITADNAQYLLPQLTIGNGYAYLPGRPMVNISPSVAPKASG
ncbi:MAG: hypothetical protein KF716_09810 [Anaerolineae bacterium]|nr:hypothetical protein [Anaerolineae bacterium]